MVGNGPEKDNFPKAEQIKVYDFMPQHEITKLINDVDFFCLPSLREPWGVVIHEMASSGLPLLLSDTCGAGTDYLINGYNGYYFENNNPIDLKEKLLILMTASSEQLSTMGKRSYKFSLNNSPEIWSYRLNQLFEDSGL